MRLISALVFFIFSVPLFAQINPLGNSDSIARIAEGRHTQGIDIALIYQQVESVKQQQLQNELAAYQLQQLRQQQQSVERNSEYEGLQRELLELQIQQERLKLEKLQNSENQQNYTYSNDQYVALTSEQVTRDSKICLYSYESDTYDFTVSFSEKCPSSIKVRR